MAGKDMGFPRGPRQLGALLPAITRPAFRKRAPAAARGARGLGGRRRPGARRRHGAPPPPRRHAHPRLLGPYGAGAAASFGVGARPRQRLPGQPERRAAAPRAGGDRRRRASRRARPSRAPSRSCRGSRRARCATPWPRSAASVPRARSGERRLTGAVGLRRGALLQGGWPMLSSRRFILASSAALATAVALPRTRARRGGRRYRQAHAAHDGQPGRQGARPGMVLA